jgi:hypothetical protein
VSVSFETFADTLRDRARLGGEAGSGIASLHGADLYLACAVFDQTRDRVLAHLRLKPEDFNSVLRALGTHLDVTLKSLLQEPDRPPGGDG